MPHRVNFTSMFKLAVFNIQHLNSNREDFFALIFSFALNCGKDWSKFNALSKSYLKLRHVPELSHSAHRDINPPQKHPPPYFLPSPLQIVQASLFRQFPIYIVLFVTPSPKNWWTPIILTFFIFNPTLSFKSN